jgi:ADP-heptose:LPS heptosyltransferase
MLSPDTGPLHMAAALETPVIGLYGYTDPKRVARPGEVVPCAEVRHGNMEKIGVDDVLEKLELAVRDFVPGHRPRA